MRRGVSRWSVLAAAVLLVLGVAASSMAAPVEFVNNGGFEAALTGWDHSANVMAADNWWGVAACEGYFMAVMSPLGILGSNLGQTLPWIDPAIYPEATVSFAYNLKGWSLTGHSTTGSDYLRLTAGGHELLKVYLDDAPGGGATELGWTLFSQAFPTPELAGPLELSFHLANLVDPLQFTVAFIDGVSVTAEPIPLPASLLLLASGLAGLAALRRRK